MIARLFADGLKRCFQGLLKLVTMHQDKAKIIRLRGKFVPIDPRGWDASMDMVVNIALGRGSDEQKMMFLNQLAQKQEMVIEKYGPYNPLVSLEQYRATLAQIIQLSGFQDPSQFVQEVTPESVQQFMQQMSGNKTADPAEMLAKVEADKTKADIIINAAKQELDRQKAIADADLKRDQLMADFMLRAYEIQAKYGTQVDVAMIKAELDRQRAELQTTFAASSAPMGM
jgi:AraC-like DNA-binding protein